MTREDPDPGAARDATPSLAASLEGARIDPRQGPALAARAAVVAALLEDPSSAPRLPPEHASPAEALARLGGALGASSATHERALLLGALALTGRYLSPEELDRAAESAARRGRAAALLEAVGAEARAHLADPHVRTLVPCPGAVLVDVTQTAGTARVSGVQRVARETLRAWREAGTAVRPFVVNRASGVIALLRDDEAEALLAPPAPGTAGHGGPLTRALHALRWAARSLARAAYDAAVAVQEREAERARARPSALARAAAALTGAAARSSARALDRAQRPASMRAQATLVPLLWDATLLTLDIQLEHVPASLLALARRVLPVRLRLVVYDLLPITRPELFPPGVRGMYLTFAGLLRDADGASCISRHVAEEVARLAPLLRARPASLAVLAHPLPDPRPEPAPPAASPSAPEGARGPLVLAVGSIEPRKNAARLLRAASRLRAEGLRFRLVLAGGHGWGARPILAELERARASGVDVELRVHVGEEELRALYASCRCSAFVSLAEGFGLPIVESLAAGRPVLTSDAGSMREVAAAGGCLLCDPLDVASIAGGLRRLLTDDALLARLSAEAAARPRRTWARYAAELHAFAAAPLAGTPAETPAP